MKSMTGYGRGESAQTGRAWTVEIRCVNNRFLDLKIKLPKGYMALEDRIRKKISAIHYRGRVDLILNVQGDFSDLQTITVNTELAAVYHKALSQIAEQLELEERSTLSQLASFPDVIVREQQQEDMDEVWRIVEPALEKALSECLVMRQKEGEMIGTDLVQRLRSFSDDISRVEKLVPELVVRREMCLRQRLDKLLDNGQLDPVRLTQEVAILADKTDVTEEIVRLRSHITQFEKFIEEDGAVGRKLDFLIQEFLREVNTLASKINDAETAHIMVDLKGELEKMREQVQNIE